MGKFLENLLRKMNLQIPKSYWQQDIRKKEILVAITRGVLLLEGITYLFYNRWYMFLVLLPLLGIYLLAWKKEIIRKKEEAFQLQFKDAMQMLASSLKAGYSVENAIRATGKDLEPLYGTKSRIYKEFSIMTHQLSMNSSVDYVLTEFEKRVNQEDVGSFVTVFVVARKSGGDSIAIIQNAVRMICDKIEVKREIQVMTAAKRYEFIVMTMIPLGIIFYMRISFSEFMSVLYGNIIGVVVMTVCLMVYGLAYLLGRKVSAIEI